MAHAADDTPRRLLEAAGEVFAAKGFQAATVREICRRAGANLAAVNYHFGDKHQLYIEAVKHAQCCGEEDPLPQWPPDTPPAAKLRGYVHRMLARFLDDRRPAWHAQLMAREMAEPTEACVALVDSYIRPSYELLDGINCPIGSVNITERLGTSHQVSDIGQLGHGTIARMAQAGDHHGGNGPAVGNTVSAAEHHAESVRGNNDICR